MVWLYPAALAGLLALAGPLIVHLLRRRMARRVVVPSLRFVRPREESSVRMRLPSDPWLLALRAGIVAGAALALARPLLLTDLRTSRWAGRTARVVVVDASESAGPGMDRVLVDGESSGADPRLVVETADLRAGLRRAAAWLDSAPPARREIVVLSDFQAGALSPADLAQVPDAIGLRFVPTPSAPLTAAAGAVRLLDGDRNLDGRVSLDEGKTAVAFVPLPPDLDGLEIRAAGGARAQVEALVRVIRAAGAAAPSREQPIVVRFPGAAPMEDAPAPADGWAGPAALRLLRSPAIAGVDMRVSPTPGALVLDVNAEPASLDAARAVKAALDARRDPAELHELEPVRLDASTLAGWSRPAGPADPGAWRHTDESDGRWLWGLALVLLAVESIVRRSPAPEREERRQHAA